ncbi:MAG: hypothetical protein ACJA08_001422 [Cyclobacteriaceae bacterium]|jgi:hypothetical protein
MNPYKENPKTFGISYHPWVHLVIKCLKAKEIPFDLIDKELSELYHHDCSAEEVYHYVRLKTIKSAVLNLIWHDDFGKEELQFTNNDSIRHFYKLYPKVREVMETKVGKYYK